jgi:hypothetical protein
LNEPAKLEYTHAVVRSGAAVSAERP